jgi:ribosome-binding protein aMBF1 (putative translation factor)
MVFGGRILHAFPMADGNGGSRQEDEELKAKIGDLVRRLRTDRGWSQEDLADEARMHTNHVGFVERGEKMPTVGVLRRVARALGVKLSAFLEQIGE